MRAYKIFFVGLAVLLMTACSAEPITLPASTPLPSVPVQLDPVVEWLRPAIQTCSQQIPERNWIVLSEDTQLAAEFETAVHVYSNLDTRASQNTFLITSDALQVVTNPALSLGSLTFSELQAVFSGKINQWDEIAENLPEAEIQVWLYPQSMSIAENFNRWSGLSPQSLSPLAYLAPHPLQLRNAIAENPFAIGILPTRWMNAQVVFVNIEGDQNIREFPVLAELTAPDPYVREWLFCIQNQVRQ